MALLGIDVGTGGTRAVLVSEDGTLLSSATAEHADFESPKTGWAEQDPLDWWRACGEAVRAALNFAGKTGADVTAVGLSGQMHGSVLLDKDNNSLRPAILWCDGRTTAQCREITQRVGAERLIELVSNPALEGFTLPKLLWVRETEPELWSNVASVLLPKDYVRLRLTGEHATDVADASGTLMLDVVNRRWSKEMLGIFEIDERLLPRVFESQEVCGHISADGAAATGLLEGTPVVAGAGDQAAGATGLGIVKSGAVSATIGTSGVVFAATDRPLLDKAGRIHTFCHAIPDRWHVMGVTQSAGLSLRWFRDQFGPRSATNGDSVAEDPYNRLGAEAAEIPSGSDGLLWAPYLMGERTPHLDPAARAALVGLTASHTRGHVVRAILEGVAFSLRDTFSIFEDMGVAVGSIRLGGGGARSPIWRTIQAEVYGGPVEILQAEEGAAYGAALLAGVGSEVWNSVDEACDKVVAVASTVTPEPENIVVMTERYGAYRMVYPALKSIPF